MSDIIDIFWQCSQQNQIANLKNEVSRLKETAQASPKDNSTGSELNQLHAEIGELRLFVATILRVLQAKQIITREDLRKLVEQVDDEDGERNQSHAGELLP